MNTRYAIQHTKNGLYVRDLAPYTMPSATERADEAKTWASKRTAQANIERYNLTNVAVVPMEVSA